MSGKFSRSKGQRGELAVAGIIHELTGWTVKRKVRQHDGDSDLEGVPGWAIECKNHATITIPAWWRQTVDQAHNGNIPVLFYKVPRKGWRAMWPISAMINHDADYWDHIDYTCDTTIEAWAVVARDMVEALTEDAQEDKADALNDGEHVH